MKKILIFTVLLLVMTLPATATDLKQGDVDPANGKVIKYWAAPMDPTYIRNEPGQSPMGMDLVIVYEEEGGEKEPTSTIRIDPVTVQNMGVRTGTVEKMELKKSIRAFGTVTYDETKIYAVNLKFDGWIEKLHVNFVGESVVKGQPLFEIYSPALVTAQEEYLLAVNQQKRLAGSPYEEIKKGSDRLVSAARQRLLYWDLSEKDLGNLVERGEVKKKLTIHSPATGVVIKKESLDGHFVKAGMHQYDIADLSRVWVDVEIYEYELPLVKEGMQVEMELSYLPGKIYEGTILFIYPYLNPETRTARIRLAFDNSDKLLKPDMYANVFITSIIDKEALVIPQEAVIDSGVRRIVFVAKGKGRFEPREVEVGLEGENNHLQVLSGLTEGEKIVTSGQFMFDSESRLQEAIQKMLDARNVTGDENSLDDLDMEDLKMDDDLDMSEMSMDS